MPKRSASEAGMDEIDYSFVAQDQIIPTSADGMDLHQLGAYAESVREILTNGRSLAVATGRIASPPSGAAIEAQAIEHMSTLERMYWTGYQSGRQLPVVDWNTLHKDLLHTSAHIKKMGDRRAALRILYDKLDITSEQTYAWLEEHQLLIHLVKAQMRVIGASRDVAAKRDHSSPERMALAELRACEAYRNTVAKRFRELNGEMKDQFEAVDAAVRVLNARKDALERLGRSRAE
ncbi:hypothetical protein LTR56_023293 [Elasticomyces elasticus]|nr:hypothetical protein LTR56_023293 [Elasticomyces elasticus]KAK4913854.1 hypothetical protein LTR49_017890 [Elasticomyces elasticus]